MNDINIAGSESTPRIRADGSAGRLEMSGDSYPENSFELFQPVLEWVGAFLDGGGTRPLAVDLQLLYLNTSSVRAMMEIFDTLQEAHERGRAVSVTWRYDRKNERVADLAGEFKEDYTFPFEIVPES
ncbi:MAG TPA: biofilm regulation phosphoprotein SiaC [Aromatoleum sp.]|uniref:biofilm regulation phosphoprotein SiaC n=1 Tax=Aromatoleum sp. TaxID=2307007 RepID=UPI002B496A1F|nr:biofilm regulation phosphoprotein SiaC [Aromatoleum sp.]HJV27974.1 biofilm regulation phosphoprotein SiaC [Aromatoleum sp.]